MEIRAVPMAMRAAPMRTLPARLESRSQRRENAVDRDANRGRAIKEGVAADAAPAANETSGAGEIGPRATRRLVREGVTTMRSRPT
jgi:hypothetical protein